MSRSGYTDDPVNPERMALYRQAVRRAIQGKRGQRLLADLVKALDAMPVKRLITGALVDDGEACALGVVALGRGRYVGCPYYCRLKRRQR